MQKVHDSLLEATLPISHPKINLSPILSEIYQYRAIGERLGTAGQPSESQFRLIREAGFEGVINLALATSDGALADEHSVVSGLGMSYVHIPVDFQTPTSQNLRDFYQAMESFADHPIFVHCAANMRVSAFVFLHRVQIQGIAIPEAERDLHAIWQPDEVWTRFIQSELEKRQPVA